MTPSELMFKRSKTLFTSIRDRSPSELENQTLLDYHRKCHMLYAGNIKRNPPNKQFINSLVSYHDRLVKEMLKRGMKHNTPLKKI
jgi:hypothetical protein